MESPPDYQTLTKTLLEKSFHSEEQLETVMEKCLPKLNSAEFKDFNHAIMEECWNSPTLKKRKTLEAVVKMANCREYFQECDSDLDSDSNSGTNDSDIDSDSGTKALAADLVRNGTIQDLEVLDHRLNRMNVIKMKIKGIKEIVHLYACRLYYGAITEVGLNLGEEEYIIATRGRWCEEDSQDKKVLDTLHEALGIPKNQTRKMIGVLFFPYREDLKKL